MFEANHFYNPKLDFKDKVLDAMANHDVNVHTVSCMVDLNGQVFEMLKRGKIGITA